MRVMVVQPEPGTGHGACRFHHQTVAAVKSLAVTEAGLEDLIWPFLEQTPELPDWMKTSSEECAKSQLTLGVVLCSKQIRPDHAALPAEIQMGDNAHPDLDIPGCASLPPATSCAFS